MTALPLRRATDFDMVKAFAQLAAAKAAARDLSTCRAIAHTTATRPLTFRDWLDGRTS